MPSIERHTWLGWKTETTAGTYVLSNPVASTGELHRATDVSLSLETGGHERMTDLGRLSNRPGFMGARHYALDFTTELQLAASGADNPPEIGDLLQACGYKETVNLATDVVYGMTSDYSELQKTCSFAVVKGIDDTNSVQNTMKGGLGNVAMNFRVGEPVEMNYSFLGQVSGLLDDEATIPNPTYSSDDILRPPVAMAASLSIDASTTNTPAVSELSIDMGTTASISHDMGETHGFGIPIVTSRKPTGSFVCDLVTVATYDWWTKWKDSDKIDATITLTDANSNTCVITWDMSVTNISESPVDEMHKHTVEFDIVSTSAALNDEITMTFS